MHPELENLVNNLLSKGDLTERTRELLMKKAEQLGVDSIDFELELEGRIAETKTKTTAQQTALVASNKEGIIKKCPSCGSVAEAFSTKCKDCGHEFRNIEASTSVKDFFKMLNDLENKKEVEVEEKNPFKALGNQMAKTLQEGGAFGGGIVGQQKRDLIKNFPVPNSKEDILEFLILSIPRAKKKGNFFSSSFSDAAWEIKAHNLSVPIWQSKCEEIIMKARFAMKDDKKTLEEIENYAKQLGI